MTQISDRWIARLEGALIFVLPFIPLLFTHPFRINLFLAWEGAYRLSIGEIPYRDFGTPVGYGFWIIPALFFKVFGPRVYTLLITQAFINVGSNLLFSQFLRLAKVDARVRTISVLVFCLSYTLFNYWPWYNHLVFVFEMAGLYFIYHQILTPVGSRKRLHSVLGALFLALAFMTKQDTGALGCFIALGLLVFDYLKEKDLRAVLGFLGSYALFLGLMTLPFLQYDFLYWFNLGQSPHNSRVDKFDLLNEFLGASSWIKFYLVAIAIVVVADSKRWTYYDTARKEKFVFGLVAIAILGQASIIQVTSYTPVDGNIYFHSFAIALFLDTLFRDGFPKQMAAFLLVVSLVSFWWSGVYWNRFARGPIERLLFADRDKSNRVSKSTYIVVPKDSANYERSNWIVPDLNALWRIKIPEGTAAGIEQLKNLREWKKNDIKVLNMSELTFLSYELPYQLESGENYPLWFHKDVSFFDRELETFCARIQNEDYDVILFEDIPDLNNFYPYEIRDCIREKYKLDFRFPAPRIPDISYIEVYVREEPRQ